MKIRTSVLLILISTLIIANSYSLFGQIPPGYYDDAEGLTGEELLQALHEIIDNHNVLDYSNLWLYFEIIDQKVNGKVWDIYSDVPEGTPAYEYTFGEDQCGNYGGEGDCYNREHSFPQSWYDDAPPMNSDLFHIYPTDGFVNGMRSNNAFGTVGNVSWLSTNGSKVGSCNWPWCNGVVFEPIDEYKGDLARSYFYMLTRYENQVSNWESAMLQGAGFTDWAREMLLVWAEEDPVSQKELNRNNAIYGFQDNRNPFIDRPEFAAAVWDPTVGVEEVSQQRIEVWYSQGSLHFSNDQNVESVTVINTSGQVVFQHTTSTQMLPLPEFSSGVYLAIVRGAQSIEVVRFVQSE